MLIHVHARATAMSLAALVGLLTIAYPAETLAQASGDRVHSVRRLGGTSRFTPAIRNIKAMQTAFARPRTQRDLTTVLKIAGLTHIEAEVKKAIADGAVREVTMAPGTNLQWMALRRGGTRADILRLVRWDGPKPFAAFEFVIDDLKETYTFVIPQDCGNISLVSREPSREQARRDAEAAAARAEEARKAEEARRAEEARKAEEARRAAEAAAAAEAARKADEARRAEEARRAAEAAAAEAARQAEAARLAEERELSLRPFVAGFFGKQRRQYDENDPAGLGTAFLPGFCDPLVGAKVGFEKKLGSSQWVIAPAVGVAFNTDEADRTSLFVDGELNYKFGNGGYIGTGLGLWDFAHTDSLTPNGLVHFGIPLWKAADQRTLYFVTEGRVFFDRASDIDSNYQFWGGLRFLFR